MTFQVQFIYFKYVLLIHKDCIVLCIYVKVFLGIH